MFVSWEEDDIKARIRLREVILETRKLAGESKAKNELVNEALFAKLINL